MTRMETDAATPMVLLSFATPPAAPTAPLPLFAAASSPPKLTEKAGALALLLMSAAPIAVLGWVLSS